MCEKRHAYMIAVHKNQWQLEKLLSLLDIEEVDLYIHVDIKSKDLDIEKLKGIVKKAGIYFTTRIDVKWASYSIVESTYIMLKEALSNGPYSYYHLISGQDLPIQPIEKINQFFDQGNQQINYITYSDEKKSNMDCFLRLCYFDRFLGCEFLYKNNVIRKLSWPFRKLRYFVKSREIHYSAGSAWFDINQQLAEKVVENEQWVRKYFKTFLFPDESFLQSLVDNLDNRDKCVPARRLIDWGNSPDGRSPYTFLIKDLERIKEASHEYCFARKFDEGIDKEIIKEIYKMCNDN